MSPQHRPEKGPIVSAPDGLGPGTHPHNGVDYAPGQWGSGSGTPREEQLPSAPTRQPHGKGCWAESEAGRGPGHAHSSPLLMPQVSLCGSLEEWGGGMSLPCALTHLAFLACCSDAAKGGRTSQHWGLASPACLPAAPGSEVFLPASSAGLGAPPGQLIRSNCKKA